MQCTGSQLSSGIGTDNIWTTDTDNNSGLGCEKIFQIRENSVIINDIWCYLHRDDYDNMK